MYISSINFSLWCDFVERQFLNDEFETLINDEVINGATSNPAIFCQAFKSSSAYQDDIEKLHNKTPKEKYETLAIKDIKTAANKLLGLYKKGDDGFVSIEVDPFLAHDTEATIQEGRALYEQINMPNVMIKIPATNEGYKAMEVLISEGIPVNATLIFSPKQAQNCLQAFRLGNEQFIKANSNKPLPKAVISVFVSRFDTKLDDILTKHGLPAATFGIMNAIRIYKLILQEDLANVRCLFASTGVKSKDLKEDYYVEKLLFPNTINTAPIKTIYSFLQSGKNEAQANISDKEIETFFTQAQEANIDMQKIYEQLMQEGMEAFKQAFKQILDILK